MFKTILAILITVTLAAFLRASPAAASNAIAKQEDQVCTSCHDKPGSKLLTDEGKYYEVMRTLEGYSEMEGQFGRCTTCHVRKPGSTRLTKTGKRYQWTMKDMNGIRDYVLDRHPDVDLMEIKSSAEEATETEDEAMADDSSSKN